MPYFESLKVIFNELEEDSICKINTTSGIPLSLTKHYLQHKTFNKRQAQLQLHVLRMQDNYAFKDLDQLN